MFLLLPVVLLMLAVQLMPLAYLPSVLRPAKADFARTPRTVRVLMFLSALAGVGLGWVIRSGNGGQWLAYVLLAFLAVPVISSVVVLPFLVLRQERREKHSRDQKASTPVP